MDPSSCVSFLPPFAKDLVPCLCSFMTDAAQDGGDREMDLIASRYFCFLPTGNRLSHKATFALHFFLDDTDRFAGMRRGSDDHWLAVARGATASLQDDRGRAERFATAAGKLGYTKTLLWLYRYTAAQPRWMHFFDEHEYLDNATLAINPMRDRNGLGPLLRYVRGTNQQKLLAKSEYNWGDLYGGSSPSLA